MAEFLVWLFNDGDLANYDTVEQRLRLLIDPPAAVLAEPVGLGADPDQNVWDALDGRWADQLSGKHVVHRGNHENYACGFSGPHCWKCHEPWPCRVVAGAVARGFARASQEAGE